MMRNYDDSFPIHETDQLKAQHYQRRNAISIPSRKSSLVHNYPSFDGKTSVNSSPSILSEAQMAKMKQLMCKAIQQLRKLAGQVAEAEENAYYWQKKWAELDAQHTSLLLKHHDSLVALKATRRLLFTNSL